MGKIDEARETMVSRYPIPNVLLHNTPKRKQSRTVTMGKRLRS